MNVFLKDVAEENFSACVSLKVADAQNKFVATNVMSIAQSKIYPYLVPQAVYAGGEIIMRFSTANADNRPPTTDN